MSNKRENFILIALVITFLAAGALLTAESGIGVISINAQASPSPSCSPPPLLPAGQAIKRGTTVRVAINSNTGHFNQAQFDCLKLAFTNWNAAKQSNGSNVTFNVEFSSTAVAQSNPPGVIGDGVAVQVNIGTPPNNEHAGADMTRLDDPAIPGLDGAVIIINPGITDCTALAQTMAHEIGHLLGLDDCLSCEEGTSVMTGVLCETEGNCNLNDTTNGRVAPSECDNNAAKQQYPSPTPTPSSSPPPSCLISCEPTPPPPPRTDMDQDGYALEDDPADCNDEDPLIHPNATTMCEAMDRNCNWIDDRSEPDPISCGSPVLIDLAGNGFDLTSSDQGVWFNLTGVGAMKWSWTATQSDDAWLVLDRNDDGIISDGSELFGCITQQTRTATPNGFIALAEYDKFPNGGNRDGMIDSADSVFANLRLWQDMNHNGISEPYEILPLSSADILAIDLDYKEAGRRDRHGNRFRYRAKIHSGNNSTVQRWAWDVFLTLQP